jgi:putative toxin-antitoxin system antitoxin component (TIGR02293 family)
MTHMKASSDGSHRHRSTEAGRVAESLGGYSVLRRQVRSVRDLEDAVQRGLPKSALAKLAQRVHGSDAPARRALMLRIVPEATLRRRGRRLTPRESERTERLARMFSLAEDVLGNTDDARAFLTCAHGQLGGRRPLDAALTELGARQVEAILRSVEHGLPV